jgi:Ser/Thr protein kinase RdoA (MazF antagonist)
MPIDAGHALVTRDREVVTESRAVELALELFGIAGQVRRLDGEYDDNFHLVASDGRAWVLKVSHAGEDEGIIAAQHAAIVRAGFGNPRVVTADVDGARRHVRLLEWIPGELLASITPQPAPLLRSLGAELAKIDRALLDFNHPAAHRHMQWDLLQTGELRPEVHHIADARQRVLVTQLLERIDEEVLPVAARLRQSVIHGDANDFNVIVRDDRVVGLIDWGDMVHSATITDLAIAAAYVMTGKNDPLGAAAHVIAGYDAELPLTDA